jgi:hypothetical protein
MDHDDLEAAVKRHQAAIERIGTETRANGVHITDLSGRIDKFEHWVTRLEESIDRLVRSNDNLSASLSHQDDEFKNHLIATARNEAKISRQAIALWMSAAFGALGWLSAVILALMTGAAKAYLGL